MPYFCRTSAELPQSERACHLVESGHTGVALIPASASTMHLLASREAALDLPIHPDHSTTSAEVPLSFTLLRLICRFPCGAWCAMAKTGRPVADGVQRAVKMVLRGMLAEDAWAKCGKPTTLANIRRRANDVWKAEEAAQALASDEGDGVSVWSTRQPCVDSRLSGWRTATARLSLRMAGVCRRIQPVRAASESEV